VDQADRGQLTELAALLDEDGSVTVVMAGGQRVELPAAPRELVARGAGRREAAPYRLSGRAGWRSARLRARNAATLWRCAQVWEQ
jgi:hypothetical protein